MSGKCFAKLFVLRAYSGYLFFVNFLCVDFYRFGNAVFRTAFEAVHKKEMKGQNMSKKQKWISFAVFAVLICVFLVGSFIVKSPGEEETIQETMRNEVLHETAKISLFGIKDVNPGLISAFCVTGIITAFAVIVRIFVIPRFRYVPGKFQLLLEEAVGTFDRMAKGSSPHLNRFLGAYIFMAGAYIFIGTIFELFGFQAITMGCLSYLIILSGGITSNGLKGVGRTLKDFSLPISMSFRLFGALLSGALVTELVYYYVGLSYVLPVVVGVLFTLIHALIQAYVLTMLTALFYGEVSEKPAPKRKKIKASV